MKALVVLLPWVAVVATAADLPERVVLNLTAQPATSIAITWRTAALHPEATVELAPAGDTAAFAAAARSLPAKVEPFTTGPGAVVHHYSATLHGLTPGARYAYRVGHGRERSEWNQFCTASARPEPFRLVWFGDPQDDIAEHCSRTFREAVRVAADARFWAFSGDLASEPEDGRWGELFTAAGFAWRNWPVAMTPGNHDMGYRVKDGAFVLNAKGRRERTDTVAATWRAHFTLPENGPAGAAETSYCLDYQGARFIFIDSNRDPAAQAPWVEGLLARNPNRWTIVLFHHPFYSSGRERDDQATRRAFLALFDRYGVDLVLTGHDHTYARSHPLRNNAVAPAGTKGTVYVVSSSGPKSYAPQPLYQHLMAKTGTGLMLFHPIAIDAHTLTFEARTAAGNLYDSFTLRQ